MGRSPCQIGRSFAFRYVNRGDPGRSEGLHLILPLPGNRNPGSYEAGNEAARFKMGGMGDRGEMAARRA